MNKMKLLLLFSFLWIYSFFLWSETEIKQGKNISSIISLGPALTEELFLLGAGAKIRGVTLYCRKPADALKIEKVSTAMTVNIEKILTLKPDLVLATSLINPKSVERLRNLGIHVVVFKAAESFAELCDQFLELGRLIGKENDALSILGDVQKKVEEIRKSTEGLLKPRVIIQAGAKPLWIATKDSFMNDFIELAGGVNPGPLGTNGHISRENVLALDPDVIIITTMGIVGSEEKNEWQKFDSLSAVKNKRIFIFDSDLFCSPTPVSFVKALEKTARTLHPEQLK